MKKTKILFAIVAASVFVFAAGCQTAQATAAAAQATTATTVAVDTAAVSAEAATAVSAAATLSSDAYSDRDLDATYDTGTAISVDLSAVTGDYTITAAGVYVFSGTLSNGSIIVNAGEDDKVQIVLSGASITNSDGPAIYAVNADKVFVTALEGTVNTLSDGASYATDTFGYNPDGAIFSRCDLTINGTGTLSVDGNYKFAIVGKDDIVIVNVTLKTASVSDGIVGKDSVSIGSGAISVVAGGDGIVSENSEDTTLGNVLIDGGTITIQTGGANASSSKGIKAQASLVINGGTITIDAEDDALHSAASLTVTGGTLNLSSGDDGMHSDNLLVVSGGEVTISQSYEGIEGCAITISGGVIDITSSDDGLNAAGGADGSSSNGPRGNDTFSNDSSKTLVISGGTVTVNAEGDGLDSNGSLTITGGSVYVSGPTKTGNGALDSNGSMLISGGVVIAVSSSNMTQSFDQSSTQASITYALDSAQSAGTTISLKDASGNVVASYTPAKTYQTVIISAPSMTVGQSYTLYAGNASIATVTLSGIVTSVGSTGMSGGFDGGAGSPGGGRMGGRHG